MARRPNPRDGRDDDPLIDSALSSFNRLDPRTRIVVLVLMIVAAIAVGLYLQHQRQSPTSAPQTGAPVSPHLLLGNPSGATPDQGNRANYLMVKPYYALSYNDTSGTPNWVSWRVIQNDLGEAPRKPTFDPDAELPSSFYHVTHKDYSGSGFDRGHMCPHSDRAANREMSYATFIMSNIIPQAPHVNQKAWAQFESYCREQVRTGEHLYVVSGPLGQGGKGSNGFKETIAGGKVKVPASCWKVVVIVPESGDDDLAKISSATRVITILMPNDNDLVGEDWARFRTSAAAVESQAGLKFFDRLPDAIAQSLRQRVDNVYIPPPKPMTHGGGE
jgi:endonuclease G